MEPNRWRLVNFLRSKQFAGTLSFAVLLGIWLLLTTSLSKHSAIDPIFLPPLRQVVASIWSADIIDHLSISLFRTLIGVGIAVMAALAFAIAVATFPVCDGILAPLSGLRYIPISAFVPLSILWAGIGESQKVIIISLGAFLQAYPLYVSALTSVEQNFIDVGRVYGLSEFEITMRIRCRRSAPAVFDATRIVLGIGWSCLLTAEIVGATRGLGFLITQSQRYWRVDKVFAAMTWVGLVGLFLDYSLVRIRREAFPWDWKLTSVVRQE